MRCRCAGRWGSGDWGLLLDRQGMTGMAEKAKGGSSVWPGNESEGHRPSRGLFGNRGLGVKQINLHVPWCPEAKIPQKDQNQQCTDTNKY